MIVTELLGNRRVQLVIVAVLLAFALLAVKGVNLGIEFKGGVRIPISIISETDLTQDQMAQTIETLKGRINKFGLSQSVVRPLGGREIIVEIPQADASVIGNVEKILRQQGRFEAVIDQKVALEGAQIVGNAVGGPQGESVSVQGTSAQWELNFAATREGGEQFARVAQGKENYPVYMYLDRPVKAALLADRTDLTNSSAFSANNDVDAAIQDVLKLEGDELLLIEGGNTSASSVVAQITAANKTHVITSQGFAARYPAIMNEVRAAGFSQDAASTKRLTIHPDEEMRLTTYPTQLRGLVVNEWKAVGLLSAPILSGGLANGVVSQFYSVTGTVSGDTGVQARDNGLAEIKLLKSVISGGKLPVSTVVGSAYVVAPSLGEQFLAYSAVAIVFAIAAVMSLIAFRYRNWKLSIPIILVNLVEILLTTTFIGVFGTLDLAAVAGIIAIIGTGVNDQIIITDELLARKPGEEDDAVQRGRGVKERIGKAFFIIFTVAGVAIVSMLPLLLSGIVEVMGFALSSIVGVLIGIGITRPAFGVIIERITHKE